MKKPSPALAMLIFFWMVYALVATVVLYRALPPVQLELLVILGSIGSGLAVASLMLRWQAPSPGRPTSPPKQSGGR